MSDRKSKNQKAIAVQFCRKCFGVDSEKCAMCKGSGVEWIQTEDGNLIMTSEQHADLHMAGRRKP
jgi:hypothetical protein